MEPDKIKLYEELLCEECKVKLPEQLQKMEGLHPRANFLQRAKQMGQAMKFWKFCCKRCLRKLKKNIPKVGL